MSSDPPETIHPTSVRFSFAEVAKIDNARGGVSRSNYVRHCLFQADAPLPSVRTRRPLKDHQALAKLTALLGQAHINANINQLAKQANMGTLPVTPETEAALTSAANHVAEMRGLLIQALGLEFEP